MLAVLPAMITATWMSLFLRWPSPLEPVAEIVMQWTPLPVATFLLLNLHGAAPTLALLGAAALLLLMAAVAGLVYGLLPVKVFRSLAAGLIFAGLIWYLVSPFDWRSDLVLVTGYVAALIFAEVWRLYGLAAKRSSDAPNRREDSRASVGPAITRRQALVDSGLVIGGVGLAAASPIMLPLVQPEAQHRLFRFHPPPQPPGFNFLGLTPLVTPTNNFYVNSKDAWSPRLDGWRLSTTGLVAKKLNLSLNEMRALPSVDRWVTMECVDNPVGGPLIGNALWTGVPLRQVLARTRPRPDALAVIFRAADGYVESVPLDQAMREDMLLAYGMNGRTLTPDHGYPLRLVIPGIYGFKSVKWITGVELHSETQEGLWRKHGWSRQAEIHTTVRIDVLRPNRQGVLVAGTAFAGDRGVSRVQVRTNGEQWQDALLAPQLSKDSWRLWKIRLPGHSGAVIEARAWDGRGVPQTGHATGPYPSGARGYATRIEHI